MNRVIEVLKKHGIIKKLQNSFNNVKPPKGIRDEVIIEAIRTIIEREVLFGDFEEEFWDALMDDLAECVKKGLHIEFIENDEFVSVISNVMRDIAGILENRKGKGEE